MKKSSVIIFTIFVLFFSFGLSLYAQTRSEKVTTRVGNPTTQPPTQGGEAPPPPQDIRQGIIDEFGITMNGFTQEQLQWAWEKYWDVSHTNFINLVRGTVVTAHSGMSEQTGCKTFLLRDELGITRGDATLFKVVLIHEFGHIIYWCGDGERATTDHENAFVSEGGMTGYGASGCYGTPPITEDYAEMITYYLNRNVLEQTGCELRGVVPFADGKYPKHFETARKILGDY